MSQELCRAQIKPKLKIASIIIMMIPAVFLLVWVIPVYDSMNMFDIIIDFGFEYFLLGFFIGLGVLLIAVGFFISMLFTSKKCVLILNENGISGEKKSLFGKKSVELPFENITSIAVQNGLIDKLIDGQTVSIASATGFIRFRSVMNAQEFTDKTLVELRKFKEMTRQGAGSAAPAAAPAPAPAPAAADETDKLLKLKSLLDNGVISQEEYEEKRKELLARL